MFSDVIREALEREVVGQTRAVDAVVRGVTRLVSGLTPRDRSLCTFLFMGPTGTGKTHLIQTLAKILHGDARREVVADCTPFVPADPWTPFVAQIAPLFAPPRPDAGCAVLEAPPLSILRIEYLERGPKELGKALAAALETGSILLPEGRRGSLRNCLVFLTSALCAREILDEPARIGFTGSPEDAERGGAADRLFKICQDQAEQHFGTDLLAHLDGMIVFHGLRAEDLEGILERRVARVNAWLARRTTGCELLPAAREFLLERGRRDLRRGAHDLVRAHTRFVEFPLADLLVSGRIPPGGRVVVDHHAPASHLEFSVERRDVEAPAFGAGTGLREVAVAWDVPAAAS
jgi:ATP-dependent Clp protease ATP-binding subunit ClpA